LRGPIAQEPVLTDETEKEIVMEVRRPTAAMKADETHRAATAVLEAETAAREQKTARLRALRLEHELAAATERAAEATAKAEAFAAARKRTTKAPAKAPKRAKA
jgi:hypothetical protein